MDHLRKKQKELMRQYQQLQQQLQEVEEEIKKYIRQHGVPCTSCGRYYLTKDVALATQEDMNEYKDSNEGYAGPTLGEYYCGC